MQSPQLKTYWNTCCVPGWGCDRGSLAELGLLGGLVGQQVAKHGAPEADLGGRQPCGGHAARMLQRASRLQGPRLLHRIRIQLS